jgi:hypothetical protein
LRAQYPNCEQARTDAANHETCAPRKDEEKTISRRALPGRIGRKEEARKKETQRRPNYRANQYDNDHHDHLNNFQFQLFLLAECFCRL